MLNILQAMLQQCINHELPDVQIGFRKGRGPREQIANIKTAKKFQTNIYLCLLTMPKPMTVWITTNWKILKEMGIPDHLICLLRNLYVGQEASYNWTWKRLVANQERSTSRLYIVTLLI